MKSQRDLINWFLVLLTLAALGASAVMLSWIEKRSREELGNGIAAARDAFARAGVLKSPSDLKVQFQRMEALALQARNACPMIRQIYAAKWVKTGTRQELVLVHPFHHAALHPNWKVELAPLPAEEIEQDGEKAGVLFFDVDMSAIRAVQITLFVTAGLMFLVLGALVLRIFTQERAIVETNRVLEENRRELIRLERLSLAGLLTANIFHDLRKPVTNIKHELDDLSEALGHFAGASRGIKNMRDQVNLYFDILNDLNIERFVRSDQADEEYVDVNRVIEQALRLVRYERGAARVTLDLAQGLPLVLSHPYRLVQVFSNIIINAYQALGGHGEVRIATRALSSARDKGPMVAVEIADNGPGIPPEDLPRVFEPFHSTKEPGEGSGLGLYISKTIVDEMGGEIAVVSPSGEGARFTVKLRAGD